MKTYKQPLQFCGNLPKANGAESLRSGETSCNYLNNIMEVSENINSLF